MKYRRERVRASQFKRPELRDGEAENSPAIKALRKSLGQQQLHPVWAIALSMELLAGRRRVIAALDGDLELDANLVESDTTPADRKGIEAIENFQRSEVSDGYKWRHLQELVDVSPGVPLKVIAERLSIDPSNLTRLLSPSKCIPAVQEAFLAGRMTFSDTYAISKAESEQEQHEMLAAKLNGASRDDLERSVRRRRPAPWPADGAKPVKRVSIPLSSGITSVLSGSSLTLEAAIETYAELHRRAQKAKKEKWDISTWQKVMADEAKKSKE
jgi:ParB family transcriptional regulator, chromosome partitioning protein